VSLSVLRNSVPRRWGTGRTSGQRTVLTCHFRTVRSRLRLFLLWPLLVLAALPGAASASWIFVRIDAPGPLHDGKSWDSAFLTVQEGLDAAQPGDEVRVAQGVYPERIRLRSGVRLLGGYRAENDSRNNRRFVTVLDGERKGSVVTADNSITQAATIDGFTIRNGSGTLVSGVECGGGIYSTAAALVVSNNILTDNALETITYVPAAGGGLYHLGRSLVMTLNTVEDNRAMEGTGIYCQADEIKLEQNYVLGNARTDIDPWGGSVYLIGSRIWVNANVIAGNTEGLYCKGEDVEITANTVDRNAYGTWAGFGGIHVQGGTVLITENRVTDNWSSEAEGFGGIRIEGSDVSLTHNTIDRNVGNGIALSRSRIYIHGNAVRGNYVVGAAAAIGAWQCTGVISENEITGNGCSGGAVVQAYGTDLTVERNLIADNGSAYAFPYEGGGGLACRGSTLIRDNVIARNWSGMEGAGIRAYDSSMISGNLIVDNRHHAEDGRQHSGGGGVYVTGTSRILNNTFAGNSALEGAAVWVDGAVEFANNLLAYNQSGLEATAASSVTLRNNLAFANTEYDYRGVPDPTGTDGNLHQDPLFVNRGAGNFRLISGSPAIDAGVNAYVLSRSRDLAGGARLLDGDGDGVPVVDIGAYEYDPTLQPYTLAEAVYVLRITGGLEVSTDADRLQYDLAVTAGSAGVLEMKDALILARKAAGLEENP